MVLQRLKKYAEDYIGEPVTDAVVTVPACVHTYTECTPTKPPLLATHTYHHLSDCRNLILARPLDPTPIHPHTHTRARAHTHTHTRTHTAVISTTRSDRRQRTPGESLGSTSCACSTSQPLLRLRLVSTGRSRRGECLCLTLVEVRPCACLFAAITALLSNQLIFESEEAGGSGGGVLCLS
jgi:hypothetical protein